MIFNLFNYKILNKLFILEMIDNDPDSINEINFTKRCILMSVIAQDKSLILINSFHKIPVVKLFTADPSSENFIYSKIKGAFCYLMSKDSKNRKYFLRIYDLKDYSLAFNMEIKKEHQQYITQYRADFYFMELRQSFLGFKFLSPDSARIFFVLLGEDPKKEIIEQNEKSMNIKPKEISKTITKVLDYIKMRLKYKFENSGKIVINSAPGSKRKDASTQKKDNFQIMNINDKNGEYLETSIIPEVNLLINNLEIDDIDSGVLLFTERKLNYEKCQKILKKYEKILENSVRRRNGTNCPINIIDKDCMNIFNKNLYTELMIKNMINNIRTQKRLDIFKQEHKKRHKGIPTGNPRRRTTKGRLSKMGKRDSRLSSLSKKTSERTTLESNSEDKNRRYSYNNKPSLKFKNNNSASNMNSNIGSSNIDSKSIEKDNKNQFEKEKKKINSLQTTEMFKDMDDDDGDLDKGGFNYFSNDDKKNVNQNKINDIKNGVDIIEERPEDEEKDREHKYKKRELKLPKNAKYLNNIANNNSNNTSNNTNNNTSNSTSNNTSNNKNNPNSIAAKANIYKRPITGRSGKGK
jgi:hypothetical protein